MKKILFALIFSTFSLIIVSKIQAVISPFGLALFFNGRFFEGFSEQEIIQHEQVLTQKQAEAGVKWAREGIGSDEQTERRLLLLSQHGIQPLGRLQEDNLVDTAKNLTAWKEHVRQMVLRFGPPGLNLVHYWEIWNEPGGEKFCDQGAQQCSTYYFKILKTAYQTIKENDPQATVLFGGVAGAFAKENGFTDLVLQKGGGQYFDVFNFHSYGNESYFSNRIDQAKGFLKKYDLKKPIWITESGHSFNPESQTWEESEKLLPKFYSIAKEKGVEVLFWSNSPGMKQSLLNLDLSPSSLFYIYKELATGKKTFSLSSGWNKITWSGISGYTASSALVDIDNDCGTGTSVAISRKRKDWWEDFIKNFGGGNFNLQNEQDYFINVTKACNWNL